MAISRWRRTICRAPSSIPWLVASERSAPEQNTRPELRISTASAQHIMGQLEREGFVGPSRGSRPRAVRLAREQAAELEMLMRL